MLVSVLIFLKFFRQFSLSAFIWQFQLTPLAGKQQQCRQRNAPHVKARGWGGGGGWQTTGNRHPANSNRQRGKKQATVMGATSGSARDEWQQLQTAKSIFCRNNFNESVCSNHTLQDSCSSPRRLSATPHSLSPLSFSLGSFSGFPGSHFPASPASCRTKIATACRWSCNRSC